MPSHLNQFCVGRERWKLSYFYNFMSKKEKHLTSATAMSYDFFRKCLVQSEVFALTLVFWTQLPDPVPYFLTQTSFVPKQLTSSTSSSSSWSSLFPNICLYAWLALLALDFCCFTAPVYIVYYIVSKQQRIGAVHLLKKYLLAFGHPGVVATDEGCEQEESKL